MMPATPPVMPPEKSPALKSRHHHARYDDRRGGIGQRAFEAVTNFDPHLVLFRSDQQQHTVVLLRLAEFPEPEELVGEGFDVAALQRLHGRDHELDSGLVLQFFRFRLDVAAGVRGHDVRVIDHATAERRKVERERRGQPAEDQAGRERISRDPPRHHQSPDAPPPPEEPPPPEKSLPDELLPEELLADELLPEELLLQPDAPPAATNTRRP